MCYRVLKMTPLPRVMSLTQYMFPFPCAGIDTGGGVRIPAAYCGILGFRPSHGAVSTIGMIPVSQSLDTVGMHS